MQFWPQEKFTLDLDIIRETAVIFFTLQKISGGCQALWYLMHIADLLAHLAGVGQHQARGSSGSYHMSSNFSECRAKDTCTSVAKSASYTCRHHPSHVRQSNERQVQAPCLFSSSFRFVPAPVLAQLFFPAVDLANLWWVQAQHQMQGSRFFHLQSQLHRLNPHNKSLILYHWFYLDSYNCFSLSDKKL